MRYSQVKNGFDTADRDIRTSLMVKSHSKPKLWGKHCIVVSSRILIFGESLLYEVYSGQSILPSILVDVGKKLFLPTFLQNMQFIQRKTLLRSSS